MKNPENIYQYQQEYSTINKSMFSPEERINKAKKSIAVMKDFLNSTGKNIKELNLLDIGCSTGFMTSYYSQFFKNVIGIDIDRNAIQHAKKNNSINNITFQYGDAMNLDFPSDSFEAATCTHIYEHVPDAKQMLQEIYRVLKKNGFCYFVAGNRVSLIEPHYKLPLLSLIPHSLANHYIRLAGKSEFYYEKHLTLWGLKNLTKDFKLIDYTNKIIHDPVKYSATDLIMPGTLKQRISITILNFAYWLCPTYIWILQK